MGDLIGQTGRMYGVNAQAVWDAAWNATIASTKRLISISKYTESVVKALHSPPGEQTAVQGNFGSAFLRPPQSALTMMMFNAEAADVAKNEGQKDERETAVMLLICHALGRCPEKWKEILRGGLGMSASGLGTLSQIKRPILERCLMPADVDGLESVVMSTSAKEAVFGDYPRPIEILLDGLLKLIQVAKEADVKDATRAIARAKILAHLPCGYLGCTANDVENLTRPKLCSGCRTVRYCSSSCQKADWKAHKIGCKAIATETAKEESPEEDA